VTSLIWRARFRASSYVINEKGDTILKNDRRNVLAERRDIACCLRARSILPNNGHRQTAQYAGQGHAKPPAKQFIFHTLQFISLV
jgi:hypothetical protein